MSVREALTVSAMRNIRKDGDTITLTPPDGIPQDIPVLIIRPGAHVDPMTGQDVIGQRISCTVAASEIEGEIEEGWGAQITGIPGLEFRGLVASPNKNHTIGTVTFFVEALDSEEFFEPDLEVI